MRYSLLILLGVSCSILSAQSNLYLSATGDALFPPLNELSRPRTPDGNIDYGGASISYGFGAEIRWTKPENGRTIGIYSHYVGITDSEINAQFNGTAPNPTDPTAAPVILTGQARLASASYWRTGLRWGIQTIDISGHVGAGVLLFTRQRTHFAVAAYQEGEVGPFLEVPPTDYAYRITDGQLTGYPRATGERQLDLENQMLRPLNFYVEAGFGIRRGKLIESLYSFQLGLSPIVDRAFYPTEEKWGSWFAVSIQVQGRVR